VNQEHTVNHSHREIIDIERPETWPEPLLSFLEEHQQFLSDRARGVAPVGNSSRYDGTIQALAESLKSYAITGWHCTRLTDAEIAAILAGGMQIPELEMLIRRVDAVVADGLIPAGFAGRLKGKNQADDENRKVLCFFFYPPARAGEGGINRFFRCWGGESLYNSHEDDRLMAKLLGKIGTPSLVEADIPLDLLEDTVGVALKMVDRFLVARGLLSVDVANHEDRIVQPLPAKAIRRIIRYPSKEFRELTGCDGRRLIPEAKG
jgi:hypothetical protein